MKYLIAVLLLINVAYAKKIVLTSDNSVSLYGPVTNASVGDLMYDFQALNTDSKEPIYLVLNTPGGSVHAGLNLISYMKTLKRPVIVVANFAASMGFHILQHSPVRYVTEHGTIMSHRVSGGFQGEIPEQINSRLKDIVDVANRMDKHVVSRNKKHTLASYKELIRDEYWVSGETAIKDGFVDEIAELSCDDSLSGTVTKTVQVMIFQVEVNLSKCPLITHPRAVDPKQQQNVMTYFTNIRGLEF